MTDLKISTMTIVSKLGSDINLENMYKNLELSDDLVCIEWGDQPMKGETGKKIKKPRSTTKPKKKFYNQATLHFKDLNKRNGKPVNMKIFNNGSCQMTGVPNMESAVSILDKARVTLVKKQKELKELKEDTIVVSDIDKVKEYPINICLINSGFTLGAQIDRDHFFNILTEKYNMYGNYEPDSYPGINMKYYWNDLTQQDSNVCGRCVCDDYCEGTGTGCGDGQCRRISIMIFQSGQVIITGCCNIEKLEYIHKFIKKIHKNEYLTNN